MGTGASQQIRGFAQSRPTAEERGRVYATALLPEPKGAGQGALPGRPSRFVATLLADGGLQLAWDCDNGQARHVAYEVLRSLEGGPFVHLRTVGEKRVADDTLPAGTARVSYRVTAVRKARGRGGLLARGRTAEHVVLVGVMVHERSHEGEAKPDAA